MYGEAILALTEVVNSFAEREADKPTSYIVSIIDFAMKNFVSSECGHGMMSRRTVQRRRTSGESLPEQLPFDPAEPPARLWRNASGRVVPKQIDFDADDGFGRPTKISHADAEQFIDNYALNDDSASDLLDQILACCETGEEKAIVRLRLQGWIDADIAEQLGVSRQTVNRRRKEIEERFERMIKARSE